MHLDVDNRAVLAQKTPLLGKTLLLASQEIVQTAITFILIARVSNLLQRVSQQLLACIPQ